jgi:hypothetical protein
MSGYLQRMVTSAARPERALKPLVGGLFAREPLAVEEATTIARQRAESTKELQRPRVHDEMAESPVMEERLVEQRIEDGKAHVDVAIQSMSPKLEQDAVELVEHRRAIESAVAPLVEAHIEPHNAVEKNVVVRTLEREQLLVQDAGWVEEAEASEEPKSSMQGTPCAVVRATKVEPREQTAGSQESRRGPEDIHIHIGRIEVVAVPQPVQRAAPVAARRGESLEEYLKRRDRRAR